MKKLTLLLVVISTMLTSCFVQMGYKEVTRMGDFRRYATNGFTVSTVATGYSFTPTADISIDFEIGEYDINMAKRRVAQYGIDYVGKLEYKNFYPSYDYMLAILVDKAKSLGANGLLP